MTTGRFLEGSSSAGSFKDAGLPNITGSFRQGYKVAGHYGSANLGSGAFYTGLGADAYYIGGTPPDKLNSKDTYGFDASLCSSIYRNDITTVQPKSYTVLYIMKIKA